MSEFKAHIAKVAAGQALTRAEAEAAFDIIMSGNATPAQIGGFLMALRVRGETVDEIAGAVATMRSKMLTVEAPAATARTRSTSRPLPPSWSPAPACPSPSMATARFPQSRAPPMS